MNLKQCSVIDLTHTSATQNIALSIYWLKELCKLLEGQREHLDTITSALDTFEEVEDMLDNMLLIELESSPHK